MRSPLQAALHIPFYQSFRTLGYPRLLPMNYTFLVSTVCNSRCLTCNIWRQRHRDLTLSEWEQVFTSLGTSPFWVTVSGGEPFLQDHLADMVIALDKICRPTIINIPTNSLLLDEVKFQTQKILSHAKTPQFIINLSLDGVGETHDRVRGIPGNFEAVMQNYRNLKKLQPKFSNFIIGFHSVISNFNIDQTRELFDFVFRLEPDQYLTEIAEERAELDTVGLSLTPTFTEYAESIDYLIAKMTRHKYKGFGKITRAFRFQYYQFVKNWLQGKPLLPDYAGFASCEISSFGQVWPSCIKAENLGNVRSANYDFPCIWFGKKAQKVRQQIKTHGTSYPLANAFYSSALHHYPTLAQVAWKILFP